jgi:hypothetical protein
VGTRGKAGMLSKVLYTVCSVTSNIHQGPQQQQQDLTTRKLAQLVGLATAKTPQNGEKFVKKDTKRVKIGPIANGISEVQCS